MNSGRCFYHAINRKDCGYENFELLPKLKVLLEDMLFEYDLHAKGFKKTGHGSFIKTIDPYFRIEIFLNDDSPQIKGSTVWMIVENSMDTDNIKELIDQLALFGDYYGGQ